MGSKLSSRMKAFDCLACPPQSKVMSRSQKIQNLDSFFVHFKTRGLEIFSEQLMRAADFIFALRAIPAPRDFNASRVKLIAHRGEHLNHPDVRENTLAAFQLAQKKEISGIEFDVRFTKDAVPIVSHDSNTLRVFQKEIEIAETLFLDLRKILPEIPTLEEVVQNFKSKLHLMIELKVCPNPQEQMEFEKALMPLKPIVDFHILSLSTELLENLHLQSIPKQAYLAIAEFNIVETITKTKKNLWGGMTGHYLLLSPHTRQKNQVKGVGFIANISILHREYQLGTEWYFSNHAAELQDYLRHTYPDTEGQKK